MRARLVCSVVAGFVLLLSVAIFGEAPPLHDGAFPYLNAIPVATDVQYRGAGAIRPLLFWISRANVGVARITRRHREDGVIGLEMLTGSDPARAPFHVNRWGYLREVVRDDTAELVAVKTETEEESIEDAKRNVNSKDASRFLVFIFERVGPRESTTWTAVADVGREASFRDLSWVLDRMPTITDWTVRHLARPANARPGFLTAFTEMMDQTAKSVATGATAVFRAPKLLTYMHRSELFDLHEDHIELVTDPAVTGPDVQRAVRARFWIWNRQTKETSGEFRVLYGVSGALAGMPLRITYQPRWWLKTELTRDLTMPAVAGSH